MRAEKVTSLLEIHMLENMMAEVAKIYCEELQVDIQGSRQQISYMRVKPDRLGGTHDARLSLVSMQANCTIKLTHAYFFHLLLTARFLNTGLSASHFHVD